MVYSKKYGVNVFAKCMGKIEKVSFYYKIYNKFLNEPI